MISQDHFKILLALLDLKIYQQAELLFIISLLQNGVAYTKVPINLSLTGVRES
jgi:hypothetical protein